METRTPVRQGFDAVLLLSRRDASRMQIHATGIVRFDFTAVLSVVTGGKAAQIWTASALGVDVSRSNRSKGASLDSLPCNSGP